MVVGIEGFWGLSIYVIILFILQKIECDPEMSFCNPSGQLENVTQALTQYSENPPLIFLSGGLVLTIAGFNVTGQIITKYASAAQRSTIEQCKTLSIWLCFLALGQERFLWGELFGFVILVSGTLIYNEIIILPCKIMNENTKQEQTKREEKYFELHQNNQ